ncbi:response regulator [Pseudoruegeria sp. SHC-113]|uniref:response regulator n=1 Tax=Pseudoruegeria sp. SHC-113 TaxID=2855439 RepID=UPI0021BB9827|nr:response regulator [Pseudoruegeria sp. SHC-113]MCT8159124.1 response regulator [Pseudoruegeria sp. SHC-113]
MPGSHTQQTRPPLAGLTMLLVEDSRFASDAIRLMCRALGLRMRRADSLSAAWRHLARSRPDVLLADLGLPDGSGLALLSRLRSHSPRPLALLATSGDPELRGAALEAGADGFIEKPIPSLSGFEAALRKALPPGTPWAEPPGDWPRLPTVLEQNGEAAPPPDSLAYFDDLRRARHGLAAIRAGLPAAGKVSAAPSEEMRASYLARFVHGLARGAADPALEQAAKALPSSPRRGAPELTQLFHLVEERLRDRPPI